MDSILEIGIQFILFLQGFGDWIVSSMKLITFMGDEEFFLLITPILFWCVDTTVGIRTAVMLMLSTGIYNYGKWILRGPRPFWVSTDVRPYIFESSFGVPSGHSQNAVTVWGTIAMSFREKWLWIVSVILMFLIGMSRIVLSAHFPHDVLIGWLSGVILLFIFFKLEPRFLTWLKKKPTQNKIGVFFIISISMIFIGQFILWSLQSWNIPETWVNNAAAAFPTEDNINPLALSSEITVAAAFFGLSSGYVLLFAKEGFETRGTWWQLVTRYIIGVIGIIILWAGLDAVFPEGETAVAYLFRYLRYGIVDFWVTYLGPKIFIWLRLARPSQQ